MNADQHAIIRRIRRKAEILHMEMKRKGDLQYHDMREIILLIDMLEKKQ